MKIGNKEFDINNRTYIMGILNVTPDSFSDGGTHTDIDECLRFVAEMIANGADIIDVGGESTRPGAVRISASEELGRVMPIIEGIKKEFDIPISLDTYKAEVARCGINAGAAMINDVGGLCEDPDMAGVIADGKVCCCIMEPGKCKPCSFSNMRKSIEESIEVAVKAGISKDKIVIDPGIGFGKTVEENLMLINNLDKFREVGYPVLLGCSRKSIIGNVLDAAVDRRLYGTLATTAMAVFKGAAFVRVHDIRENADVVKMIQSIMGAGRL